MAKRLKDWVKKIKNMNTTGENNNEKVNNEQLTIAANEAKYPKTLKGGSFIDPAIELRSSKRFHSDPIWNRRDPQIPKSKWWLTEAKDVGFRIIRPLKQPTAEEAEAFFKLYLGV